MTIITRRTLALLFFIIFFISTPPLIMVTSGIFYDTTKNSFRKTGLLLTSSIPEGAIVTLNNEIPQRGIDTFTPWKKVKNITTPERITYLFPGVYTIRIEKKGFKPFEKIIEIKSGETTFVEHVLLLPNIPPHVTETHSFISLSEDATRLLTVNDAGALFVIDLNSGDTIHGAGNITIPSSVLWLDTPFVLLRNKTSATLVNYDTSEHVRIGTLKDSYEIKQDVKDSDTLYFHDTTGIISFNLQTKQLGVKKITSVRNGSAALDWYVYDSLVLWLYNDRLISGSASIATDNGIFLKKFHTVIEPYIIINTIKNETIAYHIKRKELILILSDNESNVNHFSTQADDMVWWWGDFEIGYLSLRTLENHLLTRFGDPIISLQRISLTDQKELFVVTTEKTVRLLERYGSGNTISTVYESNAIVSSAYDTETNTLRIVSDNFDTFQLLEYSLDIN